MSWSPEALDEGELRAFVRESNRIEGIERAPLVDELAAHIDWLEQPRPHLDALERFVRRVADASLRDRPGMDVRVGNHVPPRGGVMIVSQLARLVLRAEGGQHPWEVHLEYETLHPFMDGNGRSGRALWLWQMLHQGHGEPYALRRGFLHTFYYQTLSRSRA